MRDKLNRFIDNLNGQFVEVSYKDAIYQCMDLAYLWAFCLDIPKAAIQNQYAYQVFTNPKEITYQFFDIIHNTPDGIPQDGDLVVWNKTSGNVAGHIAIAIGGGTTSRFKAFEQNSPLGTNAHVGDKTYSNILGWLRPKVQESAVTEPNWFKILLQEANLSLENEGEFRAFWEKAVKYDDETQSLKRQIVSANEALADRAGEVSFLTEQNQKLTAERDEAKEDCSKKGVELSEATWKLKQAEAQVLLQNSQIEQLNQELQSFKENNNIMAYSWWSRFLSLFKRG